MRRPNRRFPASVNARRGKIVPRRHRLRGRLYFLSPNRPEWFNPALRITADRGIILT
jgi:hypothetical protein